MGLSRKLTLVIVLALLAGCGQAPVKQPRSQRAPVDAADTLVKQGRFEEAARVLLSLADSAKAPLSETYKLLAADAWIDARAPEKASLLLERADRERLSAEGRFLMRLVAARLALVAGNPTRALEMLPPDSAPDAARNRARFHAARAAALAGAGQYLGAARERIILDFTVGPADAAANRRAIWQMLSRAPLDALERAQASATTEPLLGWLDLAILARRYITDPVTFERALEEWSAAHQGHAASMALVGELRSTSQIEATPPAHIALLLPLKGQFAAAATAIRDGFLAAWLDHASNPERPAISVWNTAGEDILAVYRLALAAGSDFVVGPLDKPSVTRLWRNGDLSANTLALNYADVAAPPSSVAGVAPAPSNLFYQFALSPEAEAERVAERAWFEGRGSAALIAPDGKWGQRVAAAFRQTWERLGGVVAASQSYAANANDMSEPVAKLLGVDESKRRWRALKKTLGLDVKHEPRRRQDIDFIFMAAFPRQARQLRPQIKFHHASQIPVYATSHVYSGIPDATADTDIDGIMFGDMPWVLAGNGAHDRLRRQIDALWPESFTRYARLYAFGIDAYALVAQLGRLRAQPYVELQGATGWLSVGADNRIRRRLTWARFRDGVPVLADSGAPPE